MTAWEYYLTGDPTDPDDGGRTGMIRMPVGGPLALAESVLPSGDWMLSERLWKNHFEGADEPVHRIAAADAEAMMRRWVGTGRLAKYPPDESGIPPAQAERLRRAERQAAEAWSRVEIPPGAEDITF